VPVGSFRTVTSIIATVTIAAAARAFVRFTLHGRGGVDRTDHARLRGFDRGQRAFRGDGRLRTGLARCTRLAWRLNFARLTRWTRLARWTRLTWRLNFARRCPVALRQDLTRRLSIAWRLPVATLTATSTLLRTRLLLVACLALRSRFAAGTAAVAGFALALVAAALAAIAIAIAAVVASVA